MRTLSNNRIQMPSVTSIVARSWPDHIIGVENQLPWRLRTDLAHFKKRTVGHAIIMGRKTFESLGRPLPNRVNIVLSRSKIFESENVKWVNDPETALLLADAYSISMGQKELYVIGGEKIYETFFEFINKVWLTEVFCGRLNGDAVFDREFQDTEWRAYKEIDYPASTFDDWPFRITCYMRKKPQHRVRSKHEFLKTEVDVLRKLEEFSSQMSDGYLATG